MRYELPEKGYQRFKVSYSTVDCPRTYCLVEAPSKEAAHLYVTFHKEGYVLGVRRCDQSSWYEGCDAQGKPRKTERAVRQEKIEADMKATRDYLDATISGVVKVKITTINQVEKAHDELSAALENPDAGNDEVRDAAINVCLALKELWEATKR